MSAWVFDLGNSRLKAAPLLAGGGLGDVRTITHDGQDVDVDASDAWPQGDVACIASVAGDALTSNVLLALSARFGRIARVRTQSHHGDLRLAYPIPQQFGVDRFAALVAARAAAHDDVLVVGIGTALTIDLLDRSGRHRGGRIAPSPQLMRHALHARVPALPAEGGNTVDFADNTADALASGCAGAAIGLVQRARDSAARLLGTSPRLLLHGGGAGELRDAWPDVEWHPQLVLEGIAQYALASGLIAAG